MVKFRQSNYHSQDATVESYVNWLSDHNRTTGDWRDVVKNRFPGTNDSTITRILNAKRSRRIAAEQLNELPIQDSPSAAEPPGPRRARGYRVLVSIRYRQGAAADGPFVTYRQTVDTNLVPTTQELKDLVRKVLREDITSQYLARSSGNRTPPARLFTLKFLEFSTI